MQGTTPSNRRGNCWGRAACRQLLPALLLPGMVIAFGGCASKPKAQPAAPPVAQSGNLNPPEIISSKPARDGRAFREADEQLSEADWKVLEKLGPRPIWQQVSDKGRRGRTKRKDGEHLVGGGGTGGDNAVADGAASNVAPAQPEPGTAVASVDELGGIVPPTARPARPPVDEADLPVQVIPLPENKVRMIWLLRSYGGSTVDAARNGGTQRRDVKVTPPDLTALVTVLTQHVGASGSVSPLPRENTLVITCDAAVKASTLDLLDRLDVAPRQVEITAKIFEVSHDFDFQQGAELLLNRLAADGSQTALSTFSAKRFATSVGGAAAPVNGSVLKLMQSFADAGISVDVTFQLLSEAGLIKVVSSPRMTVAVGQTGYMLAGQELPIQSANLVNNIVQTTTSYKPVGVQLYITPQAISDEHVKLHTISIVSSVSGFSPLPTLSGNNEVGGFVNPIIDSREAETGVTINHGDTLVISGMRMIRSTSREEKIPGLGDLPALGWLFKNHRTQQQMTDLYFFLTPSLL
jgi:type II secretory pathway component GspD/PulD (secretin)